MKFKGFIVASALLLGLASLIWLRLASDGGAGKRGRRRGPAPVAVAPVAVATIAERVTFSGTLEAREKFDVAAHVRGRVRRLLVALGESVERGQVVAELDDDDEVQGVNEAFAERAVARANLASARSALAIAARELARIEELQTRGVVADSEVDSARSRHLSRATAVEVAEAQLQRVAASVERARIRSRHTRVVAAWAGADRTRVVARRHVDEGDRVDANQPLVTVVDLQPITAVVYVTETQYARVAPRQVAAVTTDAYPGRSFAGAIGRIAPVFEENSRQARMEVDIGNETSELRPGMFARVEVVLRRVEHATVVPYQALVTRAGAAGVFVVDGAGERVAWRPVKVGIREGDRLQVTGEGVVGRVVTLGQQLIRDGAAIVIPADAEPPTAPGAGQTGARAGAGDVSRTGPSAP